MKSINYCEKNRGRKKSFLDPKKREKIGWMGIAHSKERKRKKEHIHCAEDSKRRM